MSSPASAAVGKWWGFTWSHWRKIVPKLIHPPLSQSCHQRHLVHAPLWFSTLPALQVIDMRGGSAHPIGYGSKGHIAFCTQVQRLGYRSLGDFLVAIGGSLTIQNFMEAFLAHLELRLFRDFAAHLQQIFQKLTVLVQGLALHLHVLDFREPQGSVAGLLGAPSASRFHFFLNLRKAGWMSILRSPSPHWEARASRLRCSAVVQTQATHLYNARRWMLPPSYDIQFRVIYDLMPVNARRFFLTCGRCDPTLCPHDRCYHTESLAHCFWHCSVSRQTWQSLRSLWVLLLDHRPSWLEFLLDGPGVIHTRCSNHRQLVFNLWLLFRGILLRDIWLNRNRSAFDRPVMTPRTVAAGVRSKFSASLRSLKRRHRELHVNQDDLQVVLTELVSNAEGILPTDLVSDAPDRHPTRLWFR